MKNALLRLVVAIFAMIIGVQNTEAVVITINWLGGTPPADTTGGGDVQVLCRYVADEWELAFPGDDANLLLDIGWAPNGGGTHELIEQGGTPTRETHGRILLNNDGIQGHFFWYLDPAPWLINNRSTLHEEYVDFGNGLGAINASRYYEWIQDPMDVHCDLVSTIAHEIGHALGISYGNTMFQIFSVDGTIGITNGPLAGTVVPLKRNTAGVVSHIGQVTTTGLALMSSEAGTGARNNPSALDQGLNGFLSQFSNVNWDLAPVLKTSPTTITNIVNHHKVVTPGLKLTWLQPIGQWAVQQSTNLHTWATLTNVPSFTTNGWANISVQTTGNEGLFRLFRTDTPIRTTNSFPFPEGSLKAGSSSSSAPVGKSLLHKKGQMADED